MNVAVGDMAPEFELPDQGGERWSLRDHKGTPVVVYFYPKDNTSGCTSQACNVRDHWSAFAERGVDVVGISPDDVRTHAGFAERYTLPQTLLANPDRGVLERYGAWGEKKRGGETVMGVIRSSVVIDAEGRVAAVFDKIDPAEQSRRALEALDDLPAAS